MQRIYLFVISLLISVSSLFGQENEFLPRGFTDFEWQQLQQQNSPPHTDRGIGTPPPLPVRTMAEWEELQALTITWAGQFNILAQIVEHSKEEVEVLIVCSDSTNVKNYLTNNYGLDNLDNVSFLEEPFNSIWIRDYAAIPVYANDVDSLWSVDWIYNRPWRPLDDALPDAIGAYFNMPVYSTTTPPEDMVNTGGNFNSDGMGTAFASDLILEENEWGNNYGVTPKTEAEIDQIMFDYMGIERYIKMSALPYDVIHHIDMHFRLLDEETLLVGEYPEGVSDGPQIEANIQYVLNNFNSSFGTPYKVIRVPMPPDFNGTYPSTMEGITGPTPTLPLSIKPYWFPPMSCSTTPLLCAFSGRLFRAIT
jgi:agmatine deiminase